jgi:hypothetical protein
METRTIDLGPCRCPGTPHEHDEAVILLPGSMTYGAQRRIQSAYALEVEDERAGRDRFGGLADATLMATCTVSWTPQGPDGKTLPVGIREPNAVNAIDALDPLTAMALHDEFFPRDDAGTATDRNGYFLRAITGVVLPNPSGAPSVAGLPASPSTDSAPSPKASKTTKRAKS